MITTSVTEATRPDTRAFKADAILAGAAQWIKVRDKAGHPIAYGVPSASVAGRYHLATPTACTCIDFNRRGRPCKHSLAVAAHVARVRAGRAGLVDLAAERARRAELVARYDSLYGEAV